MWKCLLLCLWLTLGAWAQNYSAGVVTDRDGWSYLRAEPDLKSAVVGKIRQGDHFLIFRRRGDFYDILVLQGNTPELMGYVHASRVSVVRKQVAGAACVHDPDGWTNLRQGPSHQSRVLGRILQKDAFVVLEKGEWNKVLTRDGKTGFVHSSRSEWLAPRN